jgi:hypothetical protein
MAATLVREPFHRDGWVYEEKVDGWRILAYKDGARVYLVSRSGRKHTRHFAGIAAAVSKFSARSLVLDGEVAIYDQPATPATTTKNVAASLAPRLQSRKRRRFTAIDYGFVLRSATTPGTRTGGATEVSVAVGEPCGTRTHDPLIKSQVLYRLS